MSERPDEAQDVHTRLLKCALEIEDARAYWRYTDGSQKADSQTAFDAYWFGARSLARVKVLLTNFRSRFDAYPEAHRVLHRWVDMSPDTRRVICHWHMQLADPLYRNFTGAFLVERRFGSRPEVTRDVVVSWVTSQDPDRWRMSTRIQFASKLLSTAFSAGLVGSNRDPRPLELPRVDDHALSYVLYLLRGLTFSGSLLENPYLASVGLSGVVLEDRLRGLRSLRFKRQSDLIDYGWAYPDLSSWAEATVLPPQTQTGGALA